MSERRDWDTRPEDIYRCESCGYWEPRRERAVNHVPTCPYCCAVCAPGTCWPEAIHPHRRLWEAVRA